MIGSHKDHNTGQNLGQKTIKVKWFLHCLGFLLLPGVSILSMIGPQPTAEQLLYPHDDREM